MMSRSFILYGVYAEGVLLPGMFIIVAQINSLYKDKSEWGLCGLWWSMQILFTCVVLEIFVVGDCAQCKH